VSRVLGRAALLIIEGIAIGGGPSHFFGVPACGHSGSTVMDVKVVNSASPCP
jgi:hypothetical protein